MKKRSHLALTLAAGLAFCGSAFADIALWGGSQSALARVTGMEGDQALVAGPGAGRALSGATVWELRGDPSEQPKLAEWSPPYSIVRRSHEALRKRPELVAVATVSLVDGASAQRGVLAEFWPAASAEPCLLVAAWVCGSRATQTRVLELSPGAPLSARELHFFLREDEAGGRPALMLWTAAGFVAPEARFEDPVAVIAYHACLTGHADQLAIALHNGMDAKVADRHGMTLLAHCAESGSSRCMSLLLQAAPSLVDVADQGGLVPLQHAARNGREQAVQVLVAAAAAPPAPAGPSSAGGAATPPPPANGGADTAAPAAPSGPALPPPTPPGAEAALPLAAARGHAVCAGLLAESIQNLDTALLSELAATALDRGHPLVAARLLEAPAGEHASASAKVCAAFARACRRGEVQAVRLLRRLGLVPASEAGGAALARDAVLSGDLDTLRAVLEAGATPDRAAPDAGTPLAAAVEARNVEMVRALLGAGAKASRPLPAGGSLLHLAVRVDSAEILVLLLRAGAKPELADANGQTPLVLALREGSKPCASALLQGGAKMPVAGPDFEQLLETALRMDLPAAVRSLLDQGWTTDRMIAGGWPVLRVASFLGASRCEALLGEAGAGALKDLESRPRAVHAISEIDQPPVPLQVLRVDDPRPATEVFPRQTVSIDFIVDQDGQPRFVRLRNCPDRRLEKAILSAVGAQRYKPAVLAGQPVAARMSQNLAFASSRERK